MIRLRCAAVAALLLASSLSGCAAAEEHSSPKQTASRPTMSSTDRIRSVAVVGDSISVGYNACDEPGPCKDSSWATGSVPGVDSIADRLGIADPGAIHNLAFPGTRMRNASQELQRLTEPVDLVLVLAGANDLCQASTTSMTDPMTFRARIRELFAVVDQRAPGATVLMMSVPDVTQLAHVDGVPAAVQSKRVAASLCGSVLGTPDHPANGKDRAAVRARVAQYDKAIESLCRARSRCIDDGGALTAQRFTLNDVSPIDYFHPSEQGQGVIADLAWDALTRGR